MKCPVCEGKLHVTNVRNVDGKVKRFRECQECLSRFVTFESIDYSRVSPYTMRKLLKK